MHTDESCCADREVMSESGNVRIETHDALGMSKRFADKTGHV